MDSSSSARPGVVASLGAGLSAGALIGLFAGLFDGAVAAAGIDPSLFVLHAKELGLAAALEAASAPWEDVYGLAGCLLATTLFYGVVAMGAGLALGVLLHPFLMRRDVDTRRRRIAALLVGTWIFLEMYWWSRQLVFPGAAATDPRRLAAAGGLFLVGLVAGSMVAATSSLLPRALRTVTLLAAFVAFAAGGWFLADERARSSSRGAINERNADLPNVLIFVVDALRQDVLGCYGAEHVDTPVIDGLAARGVVFEEAFVQAPFTWTSFGSILTGKYPRRHGLVKMAPGVRMAPNVTLPYHLKDAARTDGTRLRDGDYVGAAFMTGTLSHGSGLLRGFDVYFEAMVGHDLVDVHSQWSRFAKRLALFQVRSKFEQRFDNEVVASTARSWFAENGDRRFVSLVHYYSTHTPYDPPEPYRGRYVDPEYDGPVTAFYAEHREAIERGDADLTDNDAEQIRDLYYAGVTQADAMIGAVLDELDGQGLLENTIVVVTSDHGEELGDHDLWEHNFMYQTNLRIPLVIAWPGSLPEGERVSAIVETVDLVPTLCDFMGLEPPHDAEAGERGVIDGVSLAPLVRGEVERVKAWTFAENGRFRSIQDGTRKLIVRREALEDGGWERVLAGEIEKPRFFDLGVDPHETRNLFDERSADAQELFLALESWSASMPIGSHMMIQSARDHQAEELLRALGYGGGVGEDSD